MKIAVVGSRNVFPKYSLLEKYLSGADEIVSGGAKGVDTCAVSYAKKCGIKLTEFLPKYELFGRGAPIVRNREIVDYADRVVVFWDGSSRGSMSVIEYAKEIGKECIVIICESE